MSPHPPVIVGGGIAGLAAAWHLASAGLTPLVLEATDRAGGVILTQRENGLVIDAGPDALLRQKPAGLALCHELGLAPRLIPTLPPRTAYVLQRGRLVPIPEGSFFGLPVRPWSWVRTPLVSWPGKARMALEPVVPRGSGEDEAVGAFVRRRFGDEASRAVAGPLLGGIHAGDAETLSTRSLFPQLLALERDHGSIVRGLRARPATTASEGAFASFPLGMGELVDGLLARLPADTVRLRARVSSIDGRGPFTLTLESGESIRASQLVLAIPLWATAELLRPVDAQLADLCATVPYASTAIVVIGVAEAQVRRPLHGTGYVVPVSERRRLLAATWITSKWPGRAPGGTVLLRGFAGGVHDPGALERTDEELTTEAFAELAAQLGIDGQPSFSRVYRWPRASPQYLVGHAARVAEIDARLSALPGLQITGSGLRGVGIPDVVADARRRAAASLMPQ